MELQIENNVPPFGFGCVGLHPNLLRDNLDKECEVGNIPEKQVECYLPLLTRKNGTGKCNPIPTKSGYRHTTFNNQGKVLLGPAQFKLDVDRAVKGYPKKKEVPVVFGPPTRPQCSWTRSHPIKLDEYDDPRVVDYCNLAIDNYNSDNNTCYKYVKTLSAYQKDNYGGFLYNIVLQAKIDDEEPVIMSALVSDSFLGYMTATAQLGYFPPPEVNGFLYC